MTMGADMTDDEVIQELKSDSRWNAARRQFSFASARIEQASQQREPLSPIAMRRMEFEAVLEIVAAFTVILCADCGVNPADLPANTCPGCQAYEEHTS
jgi:hypothetical protein